MPVISASSSLGEVDSRPSSMSTNDFTRLCSSADSCAASDERRRTPSAVSTRFHLRTYASAVLLHRGPQPCGVQFGDVDLHRLTTARRHDGLALLVHLHHQLGGLRLVVAEELLEDVGDV